MSILCIKPAAAAVKKANKETKKKKSIFNHSIAVYETISNGWYYKKHAPNANKPKYCSSYILTLKAKTTAEEKKEYLLEI